MFKRADDADNAREALEASRWPRSVRDSCRAETLS
jgi:hypothetical protein